jgi:hypothetical protein
VDENKFSAVKGAHMRYIYGHSPSTEPGEFGDKAAAIDYLRNRLPFLQGGEYRTTYMHENVHGIIFSFNGELLGELVVGGIRDATPEDQQKYAKAKKIYSITEIRLFRDQTKRVGDIELSHSQWGTPVPDLAYEELKKQALGFEWIIIHA